MGFNHFFLCVILAVNILEIRSEKYPSYDEYCQKLQKNCERGTQQYAKREKIYENYVKSLKSSKCSNCGINQFSDQTDEEFQDLLTLKQYPSQYITAGKRINLSKILKAPEEINWKLKNAVTSVKNQGSCGTCWSFSTTAMIQSNLILKGQASNEIDLAEQYLLECTPHSTCEQGFLYYATETAIQDGIPYQDELPYQERITGEDGICTRKNSVKSSPNFQFFSGISDEEIKDLLSDGPLSISISAKSWKNYAGGVHYCINEKQPKNHAVLLVGYDKNSWIIKNQWGEGWGEDGYMRISFERQNNCRIGEEIIKLSQNYLTLIIMISLVLILI